MPSHREIGYGRLAGLRETILSVSGSNPFLLVRGVNSFDHNGLSRYFADTFSPNDYHTYTVSMSIPSLEEYENFLRRYRDDRFGCVVAAGGGHVIDTAKLISLDRDHDELRASILGGRSLERRRPLVVVPTTAGTGSEETSFAVVYVNGRKFSVEHPTLRPDRAIVDPELCFSLDNRQLAVSGLDAITQSIESLLSRRADDSSARYARHALRLAWHSLPRLLQKRRRADFFRMTLAANLAGRAINVTRTTIPHALSYYFTEHYGVPHGHAVALSMGRYLELFGQRLNHSDKALEKWERNYKFVMNVMNCSIAGDAHRCWSDYLSGLGLPSSLDGVGLDYRALTDLSTRVDPLRLSNAPIEVNDTECRSLFDLAAEPDQTKPWVV